MRWVASAIAAAAAVVLMTFAQSGAALGSDPSGPIEFNRDIRPILSDRCYPCHGPDAARRKADLRLDDEASAKGERDSGGHAIVPGDLKSSELYRRITAKDAGERMPPAKSGKSLSGAEIEALGRWISRGAKWQQHWSFIPPTRPAVPAVRERPGIRNPIDAFIRARLRAKGSILRAKPSAGSCSDA